LRCSLRTKDAASARQAALQLSVHLEAMMVDRKFLTNPTLADFAHLSLTEGLFRALESQLKGGDLDFYVGPRPLGQLDKACALLTLFRNQRVVLGRRGYPLAHVRSLVELIEAEWIMTGLRLPVVAKFEEQFSVHGLPTPRAVMQTLTTLALVALLTSTDVLAFLPRQWVSSPISKDALQQIPVTEKLDGPDIVLVRRTGLPLTPLAEKLTTLFERASGPLYQSADQDQEIQ
jgi:LysR family transcriptional regulator of abg operon